MAKFSAAQRKEIAGLLLPLISKLRTVHAQLVEDLFPSGLTLFVGQLIDGLQKDCANLIGTVHKGTGKPLILGRRRKPSSTSADQAGGKDGAA